MKRSFISFLFAAALLLCVCAEAQEASGTVRMADFLKVLQSDNYELDISIRSQKAASEQEPRENAEAAVLLQNYDLLYCKDGDLSYLEMNYFYPGGVSEASETEIMSSRKIYVDEIKQIAAASIDHSAYEQVDGAMDLVGQVQKMKSSLFNGLGLLIEDNYTPEGDVYQYTNAALADEYAKENYGEDAKAEISLTLEEDACSILIRIDVKEGAITSSLRIRNAGLIELVWPLI